MEILDPAAMERLWDLAGGDETFLVELMDTFLEDAPQLLADIRQAVEHGVKISGATIHFVDRGTDTGPIIAQEAVAVEEGDTPETLAARILETEHRLFPRAVRLFADNRLRVEGRRVHVLPPPEQEDRP